MPILTVLSSTGDFYRYDFSGAGVLQNVRYVLKLEGCFYQYENDIRPPFPSCFNSLLGPYSHIQESKKEKPLMFYYGERLAPDVYSLVFTTYSLSFTTDVLPKDKMSPQVKKLAAQNRHIPYPILTPEQEYTVIFDLPARAVSVSEQGGAPKTLLPSEYHEYLDSNLLRNYLSLNFPDFDQKLPLAGTGHILSERFRLVAACQNWKALKSDNSYINGFLWRGLCDNKLNTCGETVWEILGIDQAFFSDKWAPFLAPFSSEFASLQRITETRRKDIPEILNTWERLAKLCGGLRKNQYTFPKYLEFYYSGDSDPQKIYEDISHKLEHDIKNEATLSVMIHYYNLRK